MKTKLMGLRFSLLAAFVLGMMPSLVSADDLPKRSGPVPKTTNSVPHIQTGILPNPAILANLLKRVSQIPGIEIRDTVISLPGAQGFWISEDIKLARPKAIVGGREFAHMHPNGSLHASLPPSLAVEAVKTGWATPHPWANQRPGWEGFVMIYTPVSKSQLDVVMQLIEGGYNYVTGKDAGLN